MSLYLHYLTHVKGVDANTFTFTLLERSVIEEWIIWLKNDRKCSPETCNNRLASIRAFINIFRKGMSVLCIWPTKSLRYPDRKLSKESERVKQECGKGFAESTGYIDGHRTP